MTKLPLEQLCNRQRFFMAISTLVLSPPPHPRINTFFLSASYSAMEMAIGEFLTFSEILWFDINQIIKNFKLVNVTNCQRSHGSSLEKLGSTGSSHSCWARVGILYFSRCGPFKLAYSKLNQDLAIKKCKILHWHNFSLLWAWQRLHLSLGLHRETLLIPEWLSTPSISEQQPGTQNQGNTAPPAGLRWVVSSSYGLFKVDFDPGILQAASLLHLLVSCCAASRLCGCVKAEESLLVSPEQSEGEGGLRVPCRSCHSWAITHYFLLGSCFYLFIPFHFYTAWNKAPRYWTSGSRDCCWAVPAGAWEEG